MIINNNIQALTSIYSTTAAAGSKRAGYAQQAPAKDEILLSREAQSFSGMLGSLHGSDGVRADKVAAYAEQIANGSYNVSAENIAASLLGTRF